MKTNKIMASLILAMFVVATVSPMVLAEEDEVEVISPGLGPNSALYGLENSWDRMRLGFTFNKENKAKLALRIAEERMAEAGEMAEAGDFAAAEKAQERHELFLERAENAIEAIESDGEEDVAELALRKTIAIQNRIEAHQEKISEVKARILERQKERMTSEQLAHLEEVFDNIAEKSENMESKLLQKKDNVKTQYKVLSGKTDEEVEETVSEIEATTGLIQQRANIAQRMEIRTAAMNSYRTQIRQNTSEQSQDQTRAQDGTGESNEDASATGGQEGEGAGSQASGNAGNQGE